MASYDRFTESTDRAREERKLEKAYIEQVKADFIEVMALPAFRRILSEFMVDAGVDNSPLRPELAYMAAAIGWQDAAGWWLNAVRRYCPEREAQMRAEARKNLLKPQESNNDDN